MVGDDDQSVDGGPIAHLRVVNTGDGPELVYHDHHYPIAPGTADDLGADGSMPTRFTIASTTNW